MEMVAWEGKALGADAPNVGGEREQMGEGRKCGKRG